MQPNVCVMDEAAAATTRPGWNDGSGEVYIHPSSSLHQYSASKFLSPYLIYSEKVLMKCLHWLVALQLPSDEQLHLMYSSLLQR